MPEGPTSAGKISIFVSYSRDDVGFAEQLDAALKLHNFEISIDRHSISGGEDWKRRLVSLIRDADTVVFVLSASSGRSDICRWETEESVRLGKRIIPVLCRPLEGAAPPPQLAELNYIYFYADPKVPGSGFGTGLSALVAAFSTDLDWLREHTRYLQRAMEWDAGGRPSNRLLSGADIELAKAWAARRPKNAPEPTSLHMDFIRASEAEEASRVSDQRRQLEEMAAAQAERETALRAAEQADRKRKRLRVFAFSALSVIATVAALLGWFAEGQRRNAVKERDTALLTQSRFLADAARQATEEDSDPGTGVLLALKALRDERSDDEVTRLRPRWMQAEVALEAARREMREQIVLKGHGGPIKAVAITADGSRVVAAVPAPFYVPGDARDLWVNDILDSLSGNVAIVWDSRTGTEFARLAGHSGGLTHVAVTSDGARIVTGSYDQTARVWDGKSGAEIALLPHSGTVLSVAVTADGTRVVTASLDEKDLRIWDGNSGAEIGRLVGHTANPLQVAITPDGARIVSASDDGVVRLWDGRTLAELGQLDGRRVFQVSGAPYFAITSNGARIIFGAAIGAWTWNGRTSDPPVPVLPSECALKVNLKLNTEYITGIAVAPDGASFVTVAGNDRTVRVWNTETGCELAVLRGHAGGINSVAVTADGSRVVTGSGDGTVRVWDSNQRTISFEFEKAFDVRAIAVAPDGARLATASTGKQAHVWDLATGEGGELEGHADQVTSLAFMPDGVRVVTGSLDETVRVWDAKSFQEVGQLKTLREPKERKNYILAVAVTPDGSRIITGSNDGATIWDAKSFAPIRHLKGHTSDVLAIAVSRDGARIVTGSRDTTARIWDARTFAELVVLKGNGGAVKSVAFTPDGARIITGSDDGMVRVWDAKTGTELFVLKGHTNRIVSVAVTPDGHRIITGSKDGTARLWNADTGGAPALLEARSIEVHGVAVAARSGRIITVSSDGSKSGMAPNKARIWNSFSTEQPLIDQAKSIAPRCLTAAQRERYHLASAPPSWCENSQKWPLDAVTVALEHLQAEPPRLRDAVASLNKAVSLDPTSSTRLAPALAKIHTMLAWQVFIDVARARRPQQDLGAALVDADKAVALAPGDILVHEVIAALTTRGHIYLALGRTEAACQDFELAISRGHPELTTYFGRGRCQEVRGNKEAAIGDYRKSLEMRGFSPYRDIAREEARKRLAALGVPAPEIGPSPK